MYATRPKSNETDEDLLKLQEQFLKEKAENKIKPAAKFISNYKAKNEEKLQEMEVDLNAQLANTFEAIPTNLNIGSVKEKSFQHNLPKQFDFPKGSGFPQAKRRDMSVSGSKGSIFSQQMKRLKKSEEHPIPSTSTSTTEEHVEDTKLIDLPNESYILTGQEKQQIHEENVQKLKQMSEQEILEERERLLSSLDPAIIAFLKTKRKNVSVTQHKTLSISEQNNAAENIKIEDVEAPCDLLKQPLAEKWLNFDTIETNKLAWMKNTEIPKIKKNQEYEARFDFAGFLLPFSEPIINEKNRILYHHGEESGRPGYTLQELFQLARSTVIQQKIISLNTIANILSLHSTGIYDNIIDLPIEQIFFVVRFCLDDNTPGVLNAAIKAMRNLFYSCVDEICLDSLQGFNIGLMQPLLAVDDINEDDNTVNDQQLAEINLVKCLARTDILIRIRYVINIVKPSTETIVYCLEILIRLIRDCNFIMIRVYNCENLIGSIIRHFLPQIFNRPDAIVAYGTPLLQAVKLLRILSTRSRHIAEELITKYNIMESVACYLSNDIFSSNTNGLRLQTECLNFWCVLIHYGLTLNYFSNLSPVLLRMLDYHRNNTDMTASYIMQAHVASLFNLITQVAKKNILLCAEDFYALLIVSLEKWNAQLFSLQTFSCGNLQLISSLLICLSNFHFPQVYKIVNLPDSYGFNIVTGDIKCCSNLLNNYHVHQTTANIKTLEAAAWNTAEHVVPILQTNSCLPFLRALSEYILKCDSPTVKLQFLNNKNIVEYCSQLRQTENFYLTTNWFTRIESELIMNILKISIPVQKDLDTAVFYELAVKCLTIFNNNQRNDVEYLLNEIIFSVKYYPSDILLQHLNINDRSETLLLSLQNLDKISEVYTKVLNLKTVFAVEVSTNLTVDIKIGNIIPIDWVYSPILVLYSDQQDKVKMPETEQMHLIEVCLNWILIYETYFPKLAALINPTDRFCRLACVFLASDNLFLNEKIQKLHELCFQNLIHKSYNEINFNKSIHGLNSFQDFYTQLLEQYQGVSYGNVLFGNFIIIPLAQKHDVKWRKILWSEYAGVLQIFNVTTETSILPLEVFLTPEENDLSLLKCYRRALVTGLLRRHSIFYNIANHHVEKYVASKKLNK